VRRLRGAKREEFLDREGDGMKAGGNAPVEERAPPGTPEVERRVRLGPRQAVGMVALLAIPVLAMVGTLGHEAAREVRAGPGLDVVVEYPSRMRMTRQASLRVTLTNRTEQVIDHARVRLPAAYLQVFATPYVGREPVPADGAEVGSLDPGRPAMVEVVLMADRFGRPEGTIRVTSSAGDSLTVPIRTIILP
jgi:hypothetical protein